MESLDSTQRAARDQFGRQSDRYGRGHVLEQVGDLQEALARLPILLSARVLDVATGAGHAGLFFARLGHRVTVADLAVPMLDRARRAAEAEGLQVEGREHAAESMPYANESFDLVVCRVAPHHFNSPAAFVREAARVLRVGGRLLVIDGTVEDGEPEAEAWLHYVEKLRDPSHNRLLTPQVWRGLCARAGLRVEHCLMNQFKQPDLEWYFEVAATPAANRAEVRQCVEDAPDSARRLFRIGREDGKIVWWWQRLTLVAVRG